MKKHILLFSVLAVFIFSANAAKWRINNIPGIDADFASFTEAHDAASAGDTLYFEGSPANYGTPLEGWGYVDTISKSLVVVGPGYFLNENDSSQANIVTAKLGYMNFRTGSEGSIFTGISFEGSVVVDANNITIARNHIPNMSLANGNAVTNCIIKQNFIDGYLVCNGAATNIIIKNNIMDRFESNDQCSATIEYNITTSSSNTINVYNSIIRSNIVVQAIIVNSGNLIQNNKVGVGYFEGCCSTDGQYRLDETSSARGAGYNGTDCGIFGGAQPYVLSGIPAGPHIFEAEISTSGSEGTGLPVKLGVKTQN